MARAYYTIRQAYTFSGDPIGFYAARQETEDGPVTWRSDVCRTAIDAESAGNWQIPTAAIFNTPSGYVEWEDVPEGSDLPADVFAYVWVEE